MSDFIPYLSKSLGDKSYSRFTETWRQRSTSGRSIDGGLYGQCAQFPTIKDDEISDGSGTKNPGTGRIRVMVFRVPGGRVVR